jgi:L-seryl-tRNA(Ser) seleniumtransferase
LAGTARAIKQVEADPLMRALRLDKMTLAALEATLLLACDAERAVERIPLWSMMSTPVEACSARALELASAFQSELGLNACAAPAEAYLGGGSTPSQALASAAVVVSPPFPNDRDSETELARALRQAVPPVVTRLEKGRVVFDLRTVPADQDAVLLDAVRKVCHDRMTQAGSNGVPLAE